MSPAGISPFCCDEAMHLMAVIPPVGGRTGFEFMSAPSVNARETSSSRHILFCPLRLDLFQLRPRLSGVPALLKLCLGLF
jgi:hypothetical protein